MSQTFHLASLSRSTTYLYYPGSMVSHRFSNLSCLNSITLNCKVDIISMKTGYVLQRLYAAVMDSRLNHKYQALHIRHVTSLEVVTSHFYPGWYKAMDVIYYHNQGRGMLVSPSAVVSMYPTINRYHDSWSEPFVRHAEVRLVDYLTSFKRRPSEIDVSKLCCRGCHVWLTTVNDKIVQGGGVSLWTVS